MLLLLSAAAIPDADETRTLAGLGAVHAQGVYRRVLPLVLRCYLSLAWFRRRFRYGEPHKQLLPRGSPAKERCKVVFGDQPAPSCLYRPEFGRCAAGHGQALWRCLGACFIRSTKCCLCGWCERVDADVPEQGLHADTEVLVITVDGGPDRGLAAHAGAADPGQDRREDVVAEGEQRGDDTGAVSRDVVAAGPAGFADELLTAELAQVVGGLPGGVAVLPGDLADPGGVLGDGEPARCRGEGERSGQCGPDPRLRARADWCDVRGFGVS